MHNDDVLKATLASVEEGLLSASEGFEALQQLSTSTACTPVSITPTYEQYLAKIASQILSGTMVLGVLEGQILDVCFTYDKQQYEVLKDLFSTTI